ncbi:MAG: hypothetical protein QM501_07185 [Gimesia sp.]
MLKRFSGYDIEDEAIITACSANDFDELHVEASVVGVIPAGDTH